MQEAFKIYSLYFFTIFFASFLARLRRLDLFGSFTVTLHFRVRFPTFAQMYADPPFFPVTFPEAETDATDFLEELHFTFFLLFFIII